MKKICYALFLVCTSVSAQNFQGPLNPSVAENTSCPFSYSSLLDYSPPENVFVSDDIYASASHCDCCDANTRCLEAKNFGFTIPLTASIDGIFVEVEKRASDGSIIQDNGVKLMNAGNVVGISEANPNNWPFVDTYFNYGGGTDLWGSAWSAAEINDSSFGLAFAAISYTCFGNGVAATSYIDHIRITVYFTDVATGNSSLQTSNSNRLNLFPNPTRDHEVQISIPGIEQSIAITLTDMMGKIIDERKVNCIGGHCNYHFDFSPGIYLLQVVGNEILNTQKLVVE